MPYTRSASICVVPCQIIRCGVIHTKDLKHDQLILTLFIVVFVIDSSLSVSYSFHFTLCNYFVPFGNVNVAVMV